VRVLALRHHDEDHPGLIGEALTELGFAMDVVLFREGRETPSLEGYDLLLVLGAKDAAYDPAVREAWFNRELALFADADARDIPIFGICFGAQGLCTYAGGSVARAPEPEIGWYEVTAAPGVAFEAGPWFEYHYDRCTLPDHSVLWAANERAVQAFAVGRHVGVQFHPEIDEAQLRDWLEVDADDARDVGLDIDALLAHTAAIEGDARERARRLVRRVLQHNGLLAPEVNEAH